MQQQKDCPFCGSSSKLESQKVEKEFRKEKFHIREFYYKCATCGEEFTTTSTDEVTVNQIYNQYREKHGILFPEELVRLRTKYNLSAQKMAQVLGLGINTYANYENGEMPTLANSRLISSAQNPEVFLEYVIQSKEIFSDKAYKGLCKLAKDLMKEDDDSFVLYNLNWHQRPNQFTGYVVPDISKLSNLLLLFLEKCNSTHNDKLKLNKLLFYANFVNYKNTGSSITGFSYRAVPYGPVPTNYDYLFAYLTNELKLIEAEYSEANNARAYEWYKAVQQSDTSVFNEDELETIMQILERLKDIPSWDLVELSHKERAWIELKESRDVVSYQEYGLDVEAI